MHKGTIKFCIREISHTTSINNLMNIFGVEFYLIEIYFKVIKIKANIPRNDDLSVKHMLLTKAFQPEGDQISQRE